MESMTDLGLLAEMNKRLGTPYASDDPTTGFLRVGLALLDRIERLEQEAATRKGAVSENHGKAEADPRESAPKLEGADGKPLC